MRRPPYGGLLMLALYRGFCLELTERQRNNYRRNIRMPERSGCDAMVSR